MTDSYESKFLDDPDFQSLLVACLESLQRGETIDRAALVKDYPKYASDVGQFLSALWMNSMVNTAGVRSNPFESSVRKISAPNKDSKFEW